MLRFQDAAGRWNRRDFLRIGGSLAGAGLLPGYLPHLMGAERGLPVTGKSVVFLFMHGGPSQIETFDPKGNAPADVRSATGEIETAIPGVTFGSTFPRLARLADRLTVVRSFVTGDGNHDIKPVVSRDTASANLGSLYARVVGANHPVTGLPSNALLYPQAVHAESQPGQTAFGRFDSAGALGAAYAPFIPGTGGDLQDDMQLKLPVDRLDDRRALLAALDGYRSHIERHDGIDEIRKQAFSAILGGVSRAFDLSQEDPATIARYDTAPLLSPEQIDKKWNNHKYYVDNVRTLGKLMLLARRLCEAGCGFVTVTTNFVWDMHSDVNNAGVAEGMGYMGVPFDHAVSAFLEDVEARGLSRQILLVCCGEMGRTPRINKSGGRDHWGNLAPLMLAGGGYRMGQVIGQSDRYGGEPNSDPVRIQNLVSTVMHTLFDVGELRLVRGVPNEVIRASSAEPIALGT